MYHPILKIADEFSEIKIDSLMSNLEMSNLEKLWTMFIKYGYDVRSEHRDGLDAWNKIKPLFPSFDIVWNSEAYNFYDELRKIGTFGDDCDDKKSILWEALHFLLQHGRIIHNNQMGSLLRLMQIAYNSGQFLSQRKSSPDSYTPEQLQYYDSHNLHSIYSFISPDSIPIVSDELYNSFLSHF